MSDWVAMVGDAANVPLPDESIEAVVTDPPYGLSKEPDPYEVMQHWVEGDQYDHDSGGFMGKSWDGFVPGPRYWRECYRVLKPGGHLLAFGGTRTWDLLTIAIRMGGFEIRDCLSWMYGTGFPKSHDISKAIDEAGGELFADKLQSRREAVGLSREELAERVGCTPSSVRDWEEGRARSEGGPVEHIVPSSEYRQKLSDVLKYPDDARSVIGEATDRRGDGTVGALGHSGVLRNGGNTEQAERWDGWGTALKPAWEPIVLAMKPKDGTFAENALEHGVAGLNIDGTRIGVEKEVPASPRRAEQGPAYGDLSKDSGGGVGHDPDTGRWPANVTLSHTRWCRKVGTKRVERRHIEPGKQGGFGDVGVSAGSEAKGTTEEEVEDWDCPPSCPVRQLDEQSGELHYQDPATRLSSSDEGMWGTGERVAYDDRGGASRFYYCAKASRSEREAGLPDVEGRANQHPTVKPIDLCRWLVRLVTRKEHTVLDPFMGSGSIGCAAVQERRNYIGIDLEKEYVDIANKRIGHWQPNQRDMFKDMGGPNE